MFFSFPLSLSLSLFLPLSFSLSPSLSLPVSLSSSVDFVKWSSQGMLRMNPDAMNALFKSTIDHIIQHLSKSPLPIEDHVAKVMSGLLVKCTNFRSSLCELET